MPATYDLGQVANVVTLAMTEGGDKPLKYPVMFRKADLVLITKVDLARVAGPLKRSGEPTSSTPRREEVPTSN